MPDRKFEPEHLDLSTVGEINKILGFHIRLAHGAVYRHFMETFSDLDLTQKQVSVLWLINDNPDVAQTDIAQRLRMDRATTMGIVNRLEARHYLERGDSKGDRRRKTLHLTAQGKAIFQKARAAILEHENWLKSRFTNGEIAKLMELLERIHE